MERGQARVGPYPIPGLVRRARRIADLSQREMAAAAGVSRSTVARVESGELTPSLDVTQRLLATAGLHLVVVDGEGRVVKPMRESDETRDGGGRRYPSHLDTILDPKDGEWWADEFGLARPPETFVRDRQRRDRMRAYARWWAPSETQPRHTATTEPAQRREGAGLRRPRDGGDPQAATRLHPAGLLRGRGMGGTLGRHARCAQVRRANVNQGAHRPASDTPMTGRATD